MALLRSPEQPQRTGRSLTRVRLRSRDASGSNTHRSHLSPGAGAVTGLGDRGTHGDTEARGVREPAQGPTAQGAGVWTLVHLGLDHRPLAPTLAPGGRAGQAGHTSGRHRERLGEIEWGVQETKEMGFILEKNCQEVMMGRKACFPATVLNSDLVQSWLTGDHVFGQGGAGLADFLASHMDTPQL